MRFADVRRTITKGQPLPDDMVSTSKRAAPVQVATPRRIARAKVHPDNLQPAYNRAARRAQGQYHSQRRAGLRRALRRAQLRPLPWKKPVEPETS